MRKEAVCCILQTILLYIILAKQKIFEASDSVDLFSQLIGDVYKLLKEGNSQAAVDTFNKSVALKEHWQSYQVLDSRYIRHSTTNKQ